MNSGKPGYLQFISIDNEKLLYNVERIIILFCLLSFIYFQLDIVGENYVSPNDITEQYIFTDIKRLSIDPTG